MQKTLFLAATLALSAVFSAGASPSRSPARTVQVRPYKGPVYSIFFHPLISEPREAFAVSSKQVFMDEWFVTVSEFKKVLASLYQRGFVLVSPRQFYVKEADGRWEKKDVLLPVGKKPLILSEDDVNYYKTMRTHGVISRLWVDPEGRLAGILTLPDGTSKVVYDNEVPQVLERFISVHPDFSLDGARGIIGETGYYGAFGYPDVANPKAFDHDNQVYQATKVAQKLRQMGWEFASHSYDHETAVREPDAQFEAAEKLWMKEIGPIVGPTPYYIFPFGELWNEDRTRMNFLNSLGFSYYFGVDRRASVGYADGSILLGRVAVDGRSLRLGAPSLRIFMDTKKILDPDRASLKYR
ncbi:MAG: hypothetical protein HKM06_00410 [Spirochaetales bacterium]|nr:hypothetical protein [Spirochaetales bacterium]